MIKPSELNKCLSQRSPARLRELGSLLHTMADWKKDRRERFAREQKIAERIVKE